MARTTALVATTLLAVAALWIFREPVLIFLLSLVVAAAVRTPVDHLAGRGLPKPLAIATAYGACSLVAIALGSAAIYLVGGEVSAMTADFRHLYDYAARHLSSVPWLEKVLDDRFPPADELLAAVVGRNGEQALGKVLGTAFGLVGSVVDVVFIVVLSIYWTIDRVQFERVALALLPLPQRISARNLWRRLEAELGAYARSEMTQCLLAGVVLGLGYYLLGLKSPMLLAAAAALSWLLPWVGALCALASLAIMELPQLVLGGPVGWLPVAVAGLFTLAIFAVLELVVEPRLFNRRRYNSLLIALAVIALAETFGILGLVLGPMLAVAIQAALEHLERERAARRAPTDLSALDTRMAELRTAADNGAALPPQWSSIVDRLGALIRQAQELNG